MSARELPPLHGRERELERLRAAVDRCRSGRPSVTVIAGPGGIGKSALLSRFAADAAGARDAVVLAGRAVAGAPGPFRALEPVVAALADAVQALPSALRSRALTDELVVAARMFPALRRVRAVAEMCRDAPRAYESAEVRDVGLRALAELLRRIGARRPVIVAIDDIDARDADDDVALAHVLWPARRPPPVAFVATASGEAELTSLADEIAPRTLDLGPLPEGAAEAMAARRLEALAGDPGWAISLARAAGGVPREIDALARASAHEGALVTTGSAAARARARVRALDRGSRRIVEILAVCGFPLARAVVGRAAAAGPGADELVDRLIADGWLSSCRVSDRDGAWLDDRGLRAAVLGELENAERAECHARVAEQLELYGEAEAPAVAAGLIGAGEGPAAARHALVAARQARDRLAFARAAELYERALELLPQGADERRPTHLDLGDVLAHLGKRSQSAAHFAFAAESAPPHEAARLRGRAADQFALAGSIDAALDLGEQVLGSGVQPRAGTRRPPGRLARRAAVTLRGRRPPTAAPADIDALELARIDVCWGLSVTLGIADPPRATAFHTQQLVRAIRAGEPRRIALALAIEAALEAGRGEAGRRRAGELSARATELARRTHDSYALAFVEYGGGIRALEVGAWAEAHEHLRRARALLGGRARLRSFEPLAIAAWEPVALYWLGAWGELDLRQHELLREARERGDVYTGLALSTGHAAIAELVRGDPAGARDGARRALAAWRAHPAPIAHADAFVHTHIDLYEGHADAALERVRARWDDLAASPLYRQRRARSEVHALRALSELAAAAGGTRPGELADDAMRTAKRLTRQRTPAASALGQLVRAGAFAVREDRARAERWLRAAESSLRRAGMAVHAAAALRRRGELAGGALGETLVTGADRELRAERVVEPARVTAMLAPGFSPASRIDRLLPSGATA